MQPLSKQWVMKQKWSDLLFLHWPLPKDILIPHIPIDLELDRYNDSAWISYVVICMKGTYLRGLSKWSIFRSFPQINFRTYVRYQGYPGIYFLSLDTNHFLTYTFSKTVYKLPFFHAVMDYQQNGNEFYLKSERKNGDAQFEAKYTPFGERRQSQSGSIEHFLTERYRLYTNDHSGNLFFCDVEHVPMKLQNVETTIFHNTLLNPFQHQLKQDNFLSYFSKGVMAKVGMIQKVK